MSFPTLRASNDDWIAKIASKLRAAGHDRLAELDTGNLAHRFGIENLDYKSEGDILEEIEAILDDLILEQRQTAIPIEKRLENIDRKLPTLPVAETINRPATEQTDPVSRAIALLLAADSSGKPINVTNLPAIVGCSRSTLYRDPHFTATVKALKGKNRANIPRGSKPKEGNLEAEYDPDEE